MANDMKKAWRKFDRDLDKSGVPEQEDILHAFIAAWNARQPEIDALRAQLSQQQTDMNNEADGYRMEAR